MADAAGWYHRSRPGGDLYLRQPSIGLPSLKQQQLLRIVKALWAERRWWLNLHTTPLELGLVSSRFDPCVLFFRDPMSQELCGAMAAHVDDIIFG